MNIANGGQYNGATSNTLTVQAITSNNNNQLFRCLVSTTSCSTTSDVATLFVEEIVGVDAFANSVSIYPNPTTDHISIRTSADMLGSIYQVYNSTGKLILSGNVQSNLQLISLQEFPTGMYFLTIDNKRNQSFKIVKN